MTCCSSHLYSNLVFLGIKPAGWTANSTCSHTSTCSPADSGQPGWTCIEKRRGCNSISSSPWPLQREGKHPLSCTSYSLPPAGRPPAHTLMETNKDWRALSKESCMCLSAHTLARSLAWLKVTMHLIRSSLEGTLQNETGIRQAGLLSPA